MSLTGSTDEQRIWNFFRSSGLNSYGTAGLMGNLYEESRLRSNNLQNSYEKPLGFTDESYTSAVDSGAYTNFVHDSAGYGLAQWTYYTRKSALYNYAKSNNTSISNLEMQLNYLMVELSNNYPALLSLLKSTDSIKQASNAVLTQFEKPEDMGVAVQNERASYGQRYYDKYASSPVKAYSNDGVFSVGLSIVSPDVSESGEYNNLVNPATMIDYTQIDAYIITVSRKSPDIDLKKLKDVGVTGVMIESGSLYDSIHMKRSYRNPKLDYQIRAAVDAELPFAFYHEVRSKTVKEAKKELLELQFCIQKYNPVLGVWLRLLFNNSSKINNDILNVYQEHLIQLGLKYKIGLYVTRNELKKIDWEKHCNDWLLWLDDHVSDVSEFQRLLDPEFFMTDYPSSGSSLFTYTGMQTMLPASVYSKQLFVGDSRTVGMSQSVSGLTTIAKVGAGFNFLSAQLSNIKKQTSTNIIFWFGVNDLPNVSKYISTYNQLQLSIGTNNRIYVVAVTPCSGSYSYLNPDIESFNSTMQKGLDGNIKYIDLCSYVKQIGFNSPDGLHYDSATYSSIYNYIMMSLK